MPRSPLPTHVQQSGSRRSPTGDPAARAREPLTDETAEAPAAAGPSRWRPWTTLGVSVAAWGISLYLTIAHFDAGAVPLACPHTGAINCQKVTTSPESMVFGVLPVALLGLVFWTAMIGLNLPQLWRSRWRLVAPARLAAAVTGIGFVLYLISVEALQVHAICEWCTGVHVLTFAMFMLVVTGWEDATAAWRAAR